MSDVPDVSCIFDERFCDNKTQRNIYSEAVAKNKKQTIEKKE